MNPAASLARHVTVHIMNVTVIDMNVAEDAFLSFDQDINTEQVTLIFFASVGVGDLQTTDLPPLRIPQSQPGLIFSPRINSRPFPLAVRREDNWCVFRAGSPRREHAFEPLASLELNHIAWLESGLFKLIESFLGVDLILRRKA